MRIHQESGIKLFRAFAPCVEQRLNIGLTSTLNIYLGRPNLYYQRPTTMKRHFSIAAKESKGIFDRMKDAMDNRSKLKQEEQFAKQILKMAESEQWGLMMFSEQINSSLGGWKSKIPGIRNSKDAKELKKSQKMINAIQEVVGVNANIEQLETVGKKEKLQICLKSDADLSDINGIIQQFQNMEITHRVLRHRKLNNSSLPTNEQSMKVILQEDGHKLMTSKEKRNMQKLHANKRRR